MDLFVGLDVSLNSVSVCIVEADGSLVWQGKALREPPALIKAMHPYRDRIKLVGLEACPLSEWLYGGLSESGLPTVCVEVRHAHRFLSTRLNKTDRSDARGIAEMMRVGHCKPVPVKSKASPSLRTTLIARKKFVDHMLAIEQTIRGVLKVHGLKVGNVHRCTFSGRVNELLGNNPELRVAIEPLLEARNLMRKQKVALDKQLAKMALRDPLCKRLMTIPGIGPMVSVAFKATIDDPSRFAQSKTVPACACPSGVDAARLSIGRDEPLGAYQQVRRQVTAARSLRGGQLPSEDQQEVVEPQGVGPEACQARRHEEGARSCGAQARNHHASHVDRRVRVPVWRGASRSAGRLGSSR